MSGKQPHGFVVSLRYALRGVWFGMQREPNIRWHLLILALAVVGGWYLQISSTAWLALVIVSGLVLGLEFLNTALEYVEDIIHPQFSGAVQHSKDLAAAAVLIGGITALVAAVLIFGLPILRLLVQVQ